MWPEKNRVQFTQTLTPMTVSHHKNKIESKFSLSKHKIIVFNAVRMLIHTHSLSSVVIVTILYISPSNPSRLSCKVNGFLSPFKIEHSIVMIDYHYYCIAQWYSHWHIATTSLLFLWIEEKEEKELIFSFKMFNMNRAQWD